MSDRAAVSIASANQMDCQARQEAGDAIPHRLGDAATREATMGTPAQEACNRETPKPP